MPIDYNAAVNFSQYTYLYLMSKDRLIHIAKKFILYGNKDLLKDVGEGVCVGLSSYYMANVRQGGSEQGEKFLIRLKQLIDIIEMPISDNSPALMKAKLMAEKIHAKEKLNHILITVIDIQKKHFNYVNITNYVPDPYMWIAMLPNETAHHYIDRMMNKTLKLNNNLKDSIWFAELHINLKAKYFSKDVDSIDNIRANFNDILIEKKHSYYIDSIKFILDNGMQKVVFKETDDRHYYLLDIDSFFAKHLDESVKYNTRYFELFTNNHMMILSIENRQEKVNYAFFDSNIGVFNFDDKDKLKLFLNSFLKENEKSYNIHKNENNNYKLMIAAYKDNHDIQNQLIDLSFKQEDIDTTVLKLFFADPQNITRLFIIGENSLYNVNIEFINIDFVDKLVLVKLSYYHNNEKIIKNVIINALSVDKILDILHEEFEDLFNLGRINTLIESEQNIISYYEIETIPHRLSEIKNLTKLPYLVKKIDDFIFVNEIITHDENSHLVTGNQLFSDSALSSQHTIIIQIQDDATVADAVDKLKNKHPAQTTIVQYDIVNHDYQVVHNSIDLGKQGNVRWLVVAHGSYFNLLLPQVFANGLKKLKENVFNHHEPKKIGFIACKLAGNNIIEDNALQLSRALWDNQFDAITSAYTKNIYISDSGHRVTNVGFLENMVQDISLYKKTYQYHRLTNTIYINGQDYIFSILNDLEKNNDLVNAILLENEDYLKKYFLDDKGNLNLDLIKLVSYENEAYKVFKAYHDEVMTNNLIFNSQVLLDKIISKEINDIPIWRKVNADFITQNNSHLPIATKKILF